MPRKAKYTEDRVGEMMAEGLIEFAKYMKLEFAKDRFCSTTDMEPERIVAIYLDRKLNKGNTSW